MCACDKSRFKKKKKKKSEEASVAIIVPVRFRRFSFPRTPSIDYPAKVCVGAVFLAAAVYGIARKRKTGETQRRLSHRQASMPSILSDISAE